MPSLNIFISPILQIYNWYLCFRIKKWHMANITPNRTPASNLTSGFIFFSYIVNTNQWGKRSRYLFIFIHQLRVLLQSTDKGNCNQSFPTLFILPQRPQKEKGLSSGKHKQKLQFIVGKQSSERDKAPNPWNNPAARLTQHSPAPQRGSQSLDDRITCFWPLEVGGFCLHCCMASAREQGKPILFSGEHAAWWSGRYKENKD